MAYCVNCGVELAKSEAACPLCGTEVVNPAEPERKAEAFPYPARLENEKSIKKRRGATVLAVALLLLIPIGLCMYADGIDADGKLTWSLLVAGGEGLLFLSLFSPLLFKVFRPWACILMDGAAATALLMLIAYVSGGAWFWPLGFPLAVTALILCCLLSLVLYERPGAKHIGFFIKTACVLLAAAALCVIAEWRISAYFEFITFPRWSVYVAVPCFITAMISFVLHTCTDFKDKLKRRFFL